MEKVLEKRFKPKCCWLLIAIMGTRSYIGILCKTKGDGLKAIERTLESLGWVL
jgi:hypothetical protein